MAKKALCIGINDYPGTQNDLSGCVNDAQDWAGALEGRGYSVRSLVDAQATKANMVQSITALITSAQGGDSIVITYSGHGTWVPDNSGDEPDGRDEALCPYDIGNGNVLLDDEIHEIFAARAHKVRIILISDSCHSGTVIRWAPPDRNVPGPRARFLPPAAWMPEHQLPRNAEGEIARNLAGRTTSPGLSKSLSLPGGDLLIAGCRDTEFSYDANFGGRPNGAFTYYALKALKALPPAGTYSEWYKAIRSYLPGASYPQTPQLFGSKRTRTVKVLD
jgi:hypothetical protein